MTNKPKEKFAPLAENSLSTTMNVDNTTGLPKYDFITAPEISRYLEIGLTSAYELCKQINAELAAEGYLTFRGKIPRQALMDHLPKQNNAG